MSHPRQMWMQYGCDDEDCDHCQEFGPDDSYCVDQIHACDTLYLRADVAAAERAELVEALRDLVDAKPHRFRQARALLARIDAEGER
jgi:hypothetical protein